MTIEGALLHLQSIWASMDGIKDAPDYPPEGTLIFPFAVSYEREGRMAGRSAGWGDQICTLYSELHKNRSMLPQDIAAIMPYRDQFIKALMADPTLGGNVSVNGDIRWSFGKLGWAQPRGQNVEPNTIGYRFEIEVKVLVTTP